MRKDRKKGGEDGFKYGAYNFCEIFLRKTGKKSKTIVEIAARLYGKFFTLTAEHIAEHINQRGKL